MKDAIVGNAADKDQVKAAGRRAKDRREQELNDVRFVLSDPRGRRFLLRYLDDVCLFFNPAYGADTHSTYQILGRRFVGEQLYRDVREADVDAIPKMEKEARGEAGRPEA